MDLGNKMLSTPNRLLLLVFVLTLYPKKAQLQNFTSGFEQNFYYGPEGGNAEICLFVTNFTTVVTGTINAIDGTATGIDYSSTSLPFDVTINSSEPVCYNISLFDDSVSEGFETFTVYFVTNHTTDEISRDNATVTITDDDDIDECADQEHNCNSSGLCWNTDGSFLCIYNGYNCEDIDECTEGNHSCDGNATCANTFRSFNCTCNVGYTGNGTFCEDLDECLVPNHNNCSSNASCNNTVGSFQCTCHSGYTGNGTLCEDLDECLVPNHNNCSSDATCNNTVGSFQCTCHRGYTGNGTFCEDLDECLVYSNNNCSRNATCNNTAGSFQCICYNGYTGNGTLCEDLDECLVYSNNNCSSNATCNNTAGSFQCICHNGYTGNGTLCEDIDECNNGSNCSLNANCENGIGTYQCTCKEGYVGGKIQCDDINECTNVTLSKCTGDDKRCTNYPGTYRCHCISPRKRLTEDESACVDVAVSVLGEMQIVNLPFVSAYNNTTSAEYFGTVQRLTTLLTRSYEMMPTLNSTFKSILVTQLFPSNNVLGVDYVARFGETQGISYEKLLDELTSTFNMTSSNEAYLGNSGLQIQGVTFQDYDECNPAETVHMRDCGNNTSCENTNFTYNCVQTSTEPIPPKKDEINIAALAGAMVPIGLSFLALCSVIFIACIRLFKRQKDRTHAEVYNLYALTSRPIIVDAYYDNYNYKPGHYE